MAFSKLSLYVLLYIALGLYEWFEKWSDKPVRNRGEDYLEFKDKLTRHLLDILQEFVPQVKGRIEHYHLGTPLSECTFLASYRYVLISYIDFHTEQYV